MSANAPLPNMPEAIGPTTAKIVADMAAAGVGITSVEGVSVLALPPGYQFKDVTDLFEKQRTTPNRKRGTATLHSLESLLVYIKDQQREDTGYLYADVDARTITAVLNDNKKFATPAFSTTGQSLDGAGWRDHRAVFKAELTPEAAKWIAKDKEPFSQTGFAEWIEDNFADLNNEAQMLLDVATTIQAKSGIDFSSAKRLDNGQTQLTYVETIDASAGANGTMQIPKQFTLGLRIFKGDKEGYAIKARLKYRLNSGSLKFWYELDRIERVLEDAFQGYVDKAATSGYTVLLGKPGA